MNILVQSAFLFYSVCKQMFPVLSCNPIADCSVAEWKSPQFLSWVVFEPKTARTLSLSSLRFGIEYVNNTDF